MERWDREPLESGTYRFCIFGMKSGTKREKYNYHPSKC